MKVNNNLLVKRFIYNNKINTNIAKSGRIRKCIYRMKIILRNAKEFKSNNAR